MAYRCWCGHFAEEHRFSVGCAGCDAGGKPIETIEHNYEADHDWPEEDEEEPDLNLEGQPEFNGAFKSW